MISDCRNIRATSRRYYLVGVLVSRGKDALEPSRHEVGQSRHSGFSLFVFNIASFCFVAFINAFYDNFPFVVGKH